MSLPDQTPWEMLQEFFRRFDGKTGNYTEVELKTKEKTIKLNKIPDGNIIVHDSILEFYIARGRYSDKARILIEGKIRDNYDVLELRLNSASNMILSKGKHSGHSNYSIILQNYKRNGHEIKLLVCEPGAASMGDFIDNVIYGGENDMLVQSVEEPAKKNENQIDVDIPWDLMIGYLKGSIKGHDIYKDDMRLVFFYLKNDDRNNTLVKYSSLHVLVMKKNKFGNIKIVHAEDDENLNDVFEEGNFKGNKVIKENLWIGEDSERREMQIFGEGDNPERIDTVYIDEYPRGKRGHTMRLGFGVKFPEGFHRECSYRIVGIEVV